MKRYPGIRPFRTDEQHLFFGRDSDIERLLRLIDLQQIVILYGKSGYGKSSLLSAGIVPRLQAEGSRRHWEIRLGPYKPGESIAPAESLRTAIRFARVAQMGDETPPPSARTVPATWAEPSVWEVLKNLQTAENNRYLLIFDQFEELFTYPAEQVLAFKKQLAEALFSIVPKRYEQALATANLSPEAEDAIYTPFELKVVFSIRADRMSLLNGLKDYLPNLLQHGYELDALDETAAEAAVVAPARLDPSPDGRGDGGTSRAAKARNSPPFGGGGFDTPPFSYTPAAIAAIFAALRDERGRIETSTLQIVCKHVEDNIVARAQDLHPQVTPADLGDISAIFGDFYENTLAGLPPEEQRPARHLVEEVLIKDGIRLPFAEQALRAQPGVTNELLQRLAAASLLRVERDDQGRMLYEVGHDTLVRPIEEAAKTRRAAEMREAEAARLRQEAEAQRLERAKIERARRRNLALGLGALALLAFALYQTWVARGAQALAEEKTIAALDAERKATEKDSLAHLAQMRADTANARADRKTEEARVAAEATAKAMTDLGRSTEEVVEGLAQNAKAYIYKLQYGEALGTLEAAAKYRRPSHTYTLTALELAYFYNETGQTGARAQALALLLAAPKVGLRQSPSETQKVRDYILRSDPRWHGVLQRRYYGDFAEIPGGTDTIGDDEEGRLAVRISPFRLARTETTWWQYQLFCAATGYPQPKKPGWGYEGDNPVVNVSWYDAVVFCNWCSAEQGLQPAYVIDSVGRTQVEGWKVRLVAEADGYRLPTEVEWEYAARAGTDLRYAGSDDLDAVGWHGDNAGRRTHSVAQKKANAWELYDLSGNVEEWCWDWYGAYPADVVKDYRGVENGSDCVVRGGPWNGYRDYCRSASRYSRRPHLRDNLIGFRVVRQL